MVATLSTTSKFHMEDTPLRSTQMYWTKNTPLNIYKSDCKNNPDKIHRYDFDGK